MARICGKPSHYLPPGWKRELGFEITLKGGDDFNMFQSLATPHKCNRLHEVPDVQEVPIRVCHRIGRGHCKGAVKEGFVGGLAVLRVHAKLRICK